MTEGETEFWVDLMEEWTLAEMQYAFENLNRNCTYFPRPKDVIEQIEAFRLSRRDQFTSWQCDSLCKSRHGKGYGAEDTMWLFHRYQAKSKGVSRRLTDSEVEQLMAELDKKRGNPPAWRKSSE